MVYNATNSKNLEVNMINLGRQLDITFFSKDNYVLASRIRKCLRKINYDISYCNNIIDLVSRMMVNKNCLIILDNKYRTFGGFLSQILQTNLEVIENARFVFIDDELLNYSEYVNNNNIFCIPETNLETALSGVISNCELLNCQHESIINSNINYNELISDILLKLGFSVKLLGFRYIKLCIEHAIKNNFVLGSLNKDVYSYVAMQNCTSVTNIERGIRTAIEDASKTEEFKKENIARSDKKVSNKMFLEYLLDKILIYKNKQN